MRKSLKKLLSFVLVIGIMAGSFIFAMPALAESGVVLETNGGTLASTDPIEAGEALPNASGITNGEGIFAGWYDNADLVGAPVLTAAEGTTYYAKWVSIAKVVENFDAKTDAKDWYDWTGAAKATMSHALNTNADYSYSGNNSIMFQINKGNNNAMYTDDYNRKGVFGHYNASFVPDDGSTSEGMSFWVYSTYATKLNVHMNCWTANTQGGTPSIDIQIPAGASFVTIPWTAWGENITQTNPGVLSFFFFSVWNQVNTVYVDELSSYVKYVPASKITYNMNGGSFVDGYNAPEKFITSIALPKAENVTKEGCIFAGWYDNADFTGDAVAFTPESGDMTLYAKWVYSVEVEDFETTTPDNLGWLNWSSGAVSNGGRTSEIALDTDSANAFSGNNSIKMNVLRGADVKYPFANNDYRLANYHKESMSFTKKSDGLYFFINCKTQDVGDQPKNITLQMKKGSTVIGTATVPFAQGKQFIMIPWSTFGADFNYAAVTCCTFTIKSMWSYDNLFYLDDLGAYSLTEPTPVEPSYGIATPGAAGLFSAAQSENAGIVFTPGSAVYEVGGTKYTAFRVFGTYTAPDNNGAPDFGKVVVAEGDVREIASRHVMLGYKTEPTIEKNYVMTNAKGDFDKCWSKEQNPDGSWKVTYSLLLKDIPEDYAATAFNVKSAIVTKDNTTIYSGEMVEGVSAQAIFDKIEGDKPVWFN